jgi:Protein of unknown function (DUF664)
MTAGSDILGTGSEREQLEAFLDDNRDELVATVEGLTDEQARRRLVLSRTTPLTVLKHAVFVEKAWFQVTLHGRTRAELGMPDDVDDSFVLDDADTVASLIAEYRAACDESRRIAAAHELNDVANHRRLGAVSLRWIYVHLVEELARHAGHVDILREQIRATDEQDAG